MGVDSVPVYRGPARSVNYAENLEFFETTRVQALRVPCRDCRQPVGERCVTELGQVLTKFPAHLHRIKDSQKATT